MALSYPIPRSWVTICHAAQPDSGAWRPTLRIDRAAGWSSWPRERVLLIGLAVKQRPLRRQAHQRLFDDLNHPGTPGATTTQWFRARDNPTYSC